MIHSTSLSRVCIVLSLFAAACSSDSKTGSKLGGGGQVGSGGSDAGSGGSVSESGGSTGVATGGEFSSGGDTSVGGDAAVSSGGVTSAGGAGAGGKATSHDGGTNAPDGAVPAGPCRTNADCQNTDGTPICEVSSGKCIACHTNAQCADTEECVNAVCTKLPTCTNSLGCASASGGKSICDKPNGVCVQCTQDADCGDNKVCTDRVCKDSCTSDNDCSSQHMLCNKNLGFNNQCTQCIVSTDCKDGQYCEAGACVPQTCKPSQQSCNGNSVVECNESGSGVFLTTQCTLVLFSSCIVDGDNAKCVGACENKKQDPLETDVDCGGPTCQRCAANKACVLPSDCSSNKCTSNVCGK
jgi:hypothetical protein